MLPSLLEEILKEIEIFDITEAEFKIGKKAQIEDYLNTLIKPKARFQKVFLFLIGQPIRCQLENGLKGTCQGYLLTAGFEPIPTIERLPKRTRKTNF